MSVNLFDGSVTPELIQPKKVKKSILCGSGQCNLATVLAVDTPEGTDTHRPLAHGILLQMVRDEIEKQGFTIRKEEYSLAKQGAQMFAIFHLEGENGEHGPAIAMRNSHDKSLSIMLLAGGSIFICSNLMAHVDGIKILKRHTKNSGEMLGYIIYQAVESLRPLYDTLVSNMESLKTIPVSLDEGYECIGRAMGNGMVKPQQATIVFKDWRNARHEEFSDRNANSLYNCFTQAFKDRSQPSYRMEQQVQLHQFFGNQYGYN